MKKKKMMIFLLILFLIGGVIFILNLSHPLIISEDIESIIVRNGTNGNIINITNKQEINKIVKTINEFQLRKINLISPQTGWNIILDLKEHNNQHIIRLVIRENGIEYKNSFYGTDDKVGVLLNNLEDMFK